MNKRAQATSISCMHPCTYIYIYIYKREDSFDKNYWRDLIAKLKQRLWALITSHL